MAEPVAVQSTDLVHSASPEPYLIIHKKEDEEQSDFIEETIEDIETEPEAVPEVEEAKFSKVTKDSKNVKQIVVDMEHWFTEDELKELSRKIVKLDAEIDVDENELESLKQSMKSYKDSIENANVERRKLSRLYSSGKEMRSIATIRSIDYESGLINYYDVNTDELIKTEELEEEGFFDRKNKSSKED